MDHRAALTHTGALTLRQRHWAAVLAVGASGRAYLAGLSALRAHGVTLTTPAIDVLLPHTQRDLRPPPGVRVHRTRLLHPDDLHTVGLPPATMPARSVVDAAQWARSDTEARTIIAVAFQRRIVCANDLAEVTARMPLMRRRELIRRTAADAEGGAHSLAELDVVALCRRAGLPEPGRQVRRVDASGRQRYLDMYFDEWGIHVEVDGAHHLDAEQWWADMRRQNEVWIRGDRILRFPAWVVRNRPEEVEALLRAALTAAGWRP